MRLIMSLRITSNKQDVKKKRRKPLFFMSLVESRKSKVKSRDARSCVRAPKPKGLNFNSVPELVDVLLTEGKKGPNQCLFVSAMHSKPTLFAAFLFFLAKNAMSASLLNAFS